MITYPSYEVLKYQFRKEVEEEIEVAKANVKTMILTHLMMNISKLKIKRIISKNGVGVGLKELKIKRNIWGKNSTNRLTCHYFLQIYFLLSQSNKLITGW
jgi:hypothetical protein